MYWRRAFAVCIALLASACSTTIDNRYEPLHPGNGVPVEFQIAARDRDGISRVELWVYEYELFVGPTGFQSARQRSGGTWGLVRQWVYSAEPGSISETHTVSGFPAASFIRYVVRVTDGRGRTASDTWNFAAGAWPFGNSPIPLWGNGAPAERIDIAFVADRDDYASARDMLVDLEQLIFDGYHTNTVVRRGKKYWQFYYSPERGTISDFDAGAPFIMDIPASVTGSTIIDHAAVIHTTGKRDWASGGNFGTEPFNRGTAVHESAHAAFGLKDEYAGGGHGTSTNPHHNNYNSEADCQNYNSANGWPTGDCQNIEGSWWRPEPTADMCIMLNDGDADMPDFGRTCTGRANWYYGQLEGS